MSLKERVVRTSFADIAVAETSGSRLPILFLHGNSSCKEVFHHQLSSPLAAEHRLIAMDLPGHGKSTDARDPERTYCWPGYAEAAMAVLAEMGVERAAVWGWSLGGHAAVEMIGRFPALVGLMLSGTPPVSMNMESIQTGFRPNPAVELFGKPEWSSDEATMLAHGLYGSGLDDTLLAAMKRTDGRSRSMLFASLLSGKASDQKSLVENAPMPVALVDGAEDMVVNTGYVASLKIRNLWDSHYYLLRGLGHVAFLTNPEVVTPILSRFAADMDARAAAGAKGTTVAA